MRGSKNWNIRVRKDINNESGKKGKHLGGRVTGRAPVGSGKQRGKKGTK